MQFLRFGLYILQLAFVVAQTTSVSNTSVTNLRPGLSSNGTKTLDYCRKSPECLLVMDWLTFCNDTEIDPSSKADSDAFRVCLCDPWSYYISNFQPFNQTWYKCLRCFVENFAQDQNIIQKSQLQFWQFCDLKTSNASWFLDFKWLVLIAGVPRWAYYSRPANEPTKYPWNQTNYKITISQVGGNRTTTTSITTVKGAPSHRSGASRTSEVATADGTAAPSATATGPITAPETSTASAAAATSRSDAVRRVMVLDMWTSLLLWFGPGLMLMVAVWGIVWT